MAEPRFATHLPASFGFEQASGRGCVGNASLGGVFVETTTIPERGDRLWLSFEGPDGEVVEAIGIVWWTTPDGEEEGAARQGFGLRLVASSGDYRKFLKGLSRKP